MTLGLLAFTAACGDRAETPTSPSTPTPTPPVAEPTITEEFTGRLAVGGSAFYSFSVAENGTVNITLADVGGAGVPATVWLGLGLGTPSGEDCAVSASANTPSGSTPQITGTYQPGVYCARVWDIGNLFAPAQFTILIAHP
jgi:hypothetical protein